MFGFRAEALLLAQMETRRLEVLWLGGESIFRGCSGTSMLGTGVGFGISPVILDVSAYLGGVRQAATGVMDFVGLDSELRLCSRHRWKLEGAWSVFYESNRKQ